MKSIQEFTERDLKALSLINNIYNELYELNKKEYTKEDINLYTAGIYFLFLLNDLNFQHSFLYALLSNKSSEDLDVLNQIYNLSLPITDNETIKEIFSCNRLLNAIRNFHLKSNEKIRDYLLEGLDSDWSKLSPLIFNTLFENNLDYDLRKIDGIHYTTKENIRKVLNPLFMDDLKDELDSILEISNRKVREAELEEFLRKIINLVFLDPASGAGNFLIVTYLDLLELEKRIKEVITTELTIDINHFYGIELNKTASLIGQMGLQIADLYKSKVLDIPVTVVNDKQIVNANALLCDWNNVVSKEKLSYIIGNPPFLGARRKNAEQKEELLRVFGRDWKRVGNLDYAAGWFKKAANFIKNTIIEVGFVSTTSLFQGQSVSILWKELLKRDISINFAYENFFWEGTGKNSIFVFVTAIGFSDKRLYKKKYLINQSTKKEVKHINGYLFDLDEIYPESRKHPISPVPELKIGNKPVDGGNYLFNKKEMKKFLEEEPEAEKFFRPFYGARDFLKGVPRYILYLKDFPFEEIIKYPKVKKRRMNVVEFRLKSKSFPTRSIAERPEEFHVENIPGTDYLVIPRHSTDTRDYLVLTYLDKNSLAGDSTLVLADSDPYYFGVLSSKLHMKWTEYICGRLGNGYRYSKDVVYNNFPWPEVNEENKDRVRASARKILEVREKYKDISLKDLYNPETMPKDLKEALEENDKVVSSLYGFKKDIPVIKALLKLYQKLIET